ncbi:hypothetical protein SEA_GERALT_79 [Mycobacterium phage Geralt]|uniref:Uncharacterized protein n=10 Tax=Cheoctovirus TaxID=1623281 RepID=A0A6G9LD86_9CAUD|nr:hypothetical protein M040_gp83 [Mycobacterium phage SiSi]YP_008410654.1 hypothetical protein N856_gp085 [Mycobacterium phage Daenerys]YP_009198193.1 hypothetical protein SEA_KIMBERLIUM_89 [Mycobacterium phage Kimberlium]YP_009957700.1 hypothetical protein I5H43_gp084 [Mycobacterium phage Girr]YP_009959448.1 hypothetical protein I5H60_gp084 [Mycobacterium phage Mantra]YP_009960769.1 hypothetical protein I5H73_gp083 [Mycobacterium phage OldBen]YP_009961810.1 hypothetical protein I5H83_gp087 
MIQVHCRECNRVWDQSCMDCAQWKADRHSINTGHTDIHIIPDTTPPPVRVGQGWAEWLTKGSSC